MSRWVACAVVCLAACQKEPPKPAPAPPGPTPGPVPLVSDAGAPLADAGAPVADDAGLGSGLVMVQPSMSPIVVASEFSGGDWPAREIFDGKLATAWHSAIDDPTAAWISLAVPATATIEELRVATAAPMTGLALVADGKRVAVKLDPARRDLQIVPVHAERWLLVGAKPGPTGYAELEAWGHAKPGFTPAKEHRASMIETDDPPVSPDADACAPQMAARAKFITEHQNETHEGPGGEDHNYPPTCDTITAPATDPLDGGWANPVAWCDVQDEVYGPSDCKLSLKFRHTSALITVEQEAKSARIDVQGLWTQQVAGEPWLLVRYTMTSRPEQYVVACRPDARPTCAAPIAVGDDTWSAAAKVAAGGDALILVAGDAAAGSGGSGAAPPAGALGKKPLDFARPSN